MAEKRNRDGFIRKVARKENEMALSEKRQGHDKNVEDELVEQFQLQRLKGQHLSWREKKLEPNATTFMPVRQRKAIQDGSRWR